MRQALNTSGPTVVGKGTPSKTPESSDEWSENRQNQDLIQILGIMGSPGREPRSPFRDPVVDPKDVEADAGGMFQHQLIVNGDKQLQILLRDSATLDLDLSESEGHGKSPSCEDLIWNAADKNFRTRRPER